MKGRPPKPQALEFLQGVRDARRLNFAEPQYPPASPTPPRGLKDDARAFWLEHAPALIQAGIMTIADKFAFVQLCWLYAWVRKYPDDCGAQSEFHKYLVEVGMTPLSRSRVRFSAPKSDALAVFLAKHEEPTPTEAAR